jgi:hypothetical protein
MKIYNIPVTWSVSSRMKIEAESLTEAMQKADDMPLPTDPDYIDGSFEINKSFLPYCNNKDKEIVKEIEDAQFDLE